MKIAQLAGIFGVLFAISGVGGCAPLDQQQTLSDLRAQLRDLQNSVDTAQVYRDNSQTKAIETDAQITGQLGEIEANVAKLSKQVRDVCAAKQTIVRQESASQCEPSTKTVIKNDADKMVLGEVEKIWLDPPGLELIARIDSGASSSSLHASKMAEFERDGDGWVRFEVDVEGVSVEIERQVIRYVRVFQQADKEGTRRPVVAMRIHLGDVKDTFEFTLADRSHLEHGMILGRNFLTDVALVDVSQQFIQPSMQQ